MCKCVACSMCKCVADDTLCKWLGAVTLSGSGQWEYFILTTQYKNTSPVIILFLCYQIHAVYHSAPPTYLYETKCTLHIGRENEHYYFNDIST